MAKKYYKPGEPTTRNRASIADWQLSVTFLTKEQCRLFIDEVMKLDFNIDLEYDHVEGDSQVVTTHTVTLGMSWANNLTMIAKILEKYDYNTKFD